MYFNTDALPHRNRFPVFCEEIVRCYTGLELRTDDQPRFHASFELRRAGPVDIGRIAMSPVQSARTVALVRDGDDSLLVTLIEHGQGSQTQRENDQTLIAGDAVVCDCGYPGELNIVVDSRFWNLKIPRHRIAPLLPDGTKFAGARLNKNTLARRLLLGYLAETRHLDGSAGGRAIQLYGEHLIDLIALSLGAEGNARAIAEERGARAVRRAAILREIEQRSCDRGLSAATIARTLGITPRYVHLLLEETGRSFTHHVLEQRLAKAAALLCDPRWLNRKIAHVAAEAGFADLSYFNRVFRRYYGATPSDIRAAAIRGAGAPPPL